MNTERRGFLAGLAAMIGGVFGVKASSAETPIIANMGDTCKQTFASLDWIDEQVMKVTREGKVPFVLDLSQVPIIEGGAVIGSRYTLQTEHQTYSIRATLHYLGCTMQRNEPLEGETWCRGGDLADGKLTVETWNRILRDIRYYESKAA